MKKTALPLSMFPLLAALAACASSPADVRVLAREVADVERAFARTMADRDHGRFQAFLSEEAVFISGSDVRRGKARVAAHWKRYFESGPAPFSWEPETVSVLDSGRLAISSGPVRDPTGKRIATYSSIWRLEEPGVWRIVFDKGEKYCQ